MMTVQVLINGQVIFARTVVNVTPEGVSNDEIHTYKSDDGRIIRHKRSLGYIPLAIKMLNTIKEVK